MENARYTLTQKSTKPKIKHKLHQKQTIFIKKTVLQYLQP